MALYGSTLYGVLQFGSDADAEGPGGGADAPDLMRHLPDYYRSSRIMRSIQGTAASELGHLRFALDELLRQMFVRTATWALGLWECELGLEVGPSKPIERRREQVLAHLRGVGTTTRRMIVETAAAFSGGEVVVVEYPTEHRFVIKFVGIKGIPPNMAGFIRMLEMIKPAHLAYSFEYTFSTWNMIEGLSWANVASLTWNEIKAYEGA